MAGHDVYEKFIEWLGSTWWGLPESEHLRATIEAFYTEDEAELLTGLPFSGRDLDEIAGLKGLDPVDLGRRLDALARKGAVWRSEKAGRVKYKLNDAFFVFMRGAFWSGRDDDFIRETAGPINKYYHDGFMGQFKHAHAKGLRAIPIEATVEDPRQVLPYEDVVRYLDSQDYFTVSACPCRQRKNLDPDSPSCSHPLEVCLHFGALGHYIVENGLGREITREEARDILKQSAEAGLVHGISNWRDGADTICNCCRCCCLFLEAFHVLKHHRSHDPSNYQVKINPETCQACGLCVSRCPVEALKLADNPAATNKKQQAPVADQQVCLGCGVCVYKCPSGSLILEHREETIDPPANGREWMVRFQNDRGKPAA